MEYELNKTKESKPKTWRKSLSINDKDISIRVKEVENGFVVCYDKSWKDDSGEYQYEEKEYISKTNPIKEKEAYTFEEVTNEFKGMLDGIEDI